MSSSDGRILVNLVVTSNGPTVRRSEQYRQLSVSKRIALLERWLESLAMELADTEDQYNSGFDQLLD